MRETLQQKPFRSFWWCFRSCSALEIPTKGWSEGRKHLAHPSVSRQTNAVIRTTTWCYIGRLDATRLAALTSVVPFGDIADRVKREMNIGCCHVQDCGDRPGFARVIHCSEIGQRLFDLSSTLRPDTGDSTLSHLKTESRLTGSCFMRLRKSCGCEVANIARRQTPLSFAALFRLLPLRLGLRKARSNFALTVLESGATHRNPNLRLRMVGGRSRITLTLVGVVKRLSFGSSEYLVDS